MSEPRLTAAGNLSAEYEYLDDVTRRGEANPGSVEVLDRNTAITNAFRMPAQGLPFHNASSNKTIKHEKPWHRYALHLSARAKYSATEISNIIGVSADQVRTLFKQPWFQDQYNTLVSGRADTIYESLLEGEDINSLLTLVELRDSPNVKPATRAACAFDILDRMKGKAVQRTLSVSTNLKQTSDIDAMKAELIKLETEEQELLGATAKQPNVLGVIK